DGRIVEAYNLLQLIGGETQSVNTRELVEQVTLTAVVFLDNVADDFIELRLDFRVLRQQLSHRLDTNRDYGRFKNSAAIGEINILTSQCELLWSNFLRKGRGATRECACCHCRECCDSCATHPVPVHKGHLPRSTLNQLPVSITTTPSGV